MKKYIAIEYNKGTNLTLDEFLYEFLGFDYGSAHNDTSALGEPCVSLTREPDGDYPFLTVPLRCVKEIQ